MMKHHLTRLSGAGTSTRMNATNIASGTLSTDRFSAYADLVAESKIGSGAAQVAAGDHTHAGYGDVFGPGSATDHGIAVFNGVGGYDIEDSGVTINSGAIWLNADGTARAYGSADSANLNHQFASGKYSWLSLYSDTNGGTSRIESSYSGTAYATLESSASSSARSCTLSCSGAGGAYAATFSVSAASTTSGQAYFSVGGTTVVEFSRDSGGSKIGFFGASAIAQPALSATPTAAEISTVLHNLGLVS